MAKICLRETPPIGNGSQMSLWSTWIRQLDSRTLGVPSIHHGGFYRSTRWMRWKGLRRSMRLMVCMLLHFRKKCSEYNNLYILKKNTCCRHPSSWKKSTSFAVHCQYHGCWCPERHTPHGQQQPYYRPYYPACLRIDMIYIVRHSIYITLNNHSITLTGVNKSIGLSYWSSIH